MVGNFMSAAIPAGGGEARGSTGGAGGGGAGAGVVTAGGAAAGCVEAQPALASARVSVARAMKRVMVRAESSEGFTPSGISKRVTFFPPWLRGGLPRVSDAPE